MNCACINVEDVSCFVVAGLPSCSRFSFPSRTYPESGPGRVWRTSRAPGANPATRAKEQNSTVITTVAFFTRRANLRRARSKPFIYLSLTIAIAAAVGTVKRAVGDVVRSDACRRAANEIARPADLLSPLACLGPSAGRTWGLFEDQQFRGANRGFPPWLLICRRRSAMQSMPFGGWDIRGG
jgi:hypothetical protein